jgi:hypothetical protein
MTERIGRRRKEWHAEVEEEDGSFTIISGRYAGQMDMAYSLMSAEKNPKTYIAMLQKELFQRCVTSHKMFADPSDKHALTDETFDSTNPTHMLIGELEDDAQRSLLWTMAPFMKELAEPADSEKIAASRRNMDIQNFTEEQNDRMLEERNAWMKKLEEM